MVPMQRRILHSAAAVAAITLTATAAVLAAQTVGLVVDRYSLMVEGREIAVFSELAGINSEVPTAAGQQKWQNIVLKRGATSNLEMSAWHEAVLNGDIVAARKNASVQMYSPEGRPVARYNLTNAWPSKVEISGLKAGASEVLMETVTITAERMERVAP